MAKMMIRVARSRPVSVRELKAFRIRGPRLPITGRDDSSGSTMESAGLVGGGLTVAANASGVGSIVGVGEPLGKVRAKAFQCGRASVSGWQRLSE